MVEPKGMIQTAFGVVLLFEDQNGEPTAEFWKDDKCLFVLPIHVNKTQAIYLFEAYHYGRLAGQHAELKSWLKSIKEGMAA